MPQNPPNTPVGMDYAHVAVSGVTVVKPSAGLLEAININSAVSGSVITIYDNIAGSGSVVGAVAVGSTTPVPSQVPFGIATETGLTISVSGSVDLTVIYR